MSQRSRNRYQVWPLTFVSPSTDSRRVVVSCQKACALNTINCLGGLNLPRNSVVRLTDHSNMITAVYYGSKQELIMHSHELHDEQQQTNNKNNT